MSAPLEAVPGIELSTIEQFKRLREEPRMRQTLDLPDGRTLGFAEYGEPGDPPLFYFHGFPGGRLEPGIFRFEGVHLIALDRPGYGLSDALPNRTLQHSYEDLARLADSLGFDRFGVVGASGGAPYALAAGHDLPDRVRRIATVCGLGPPEAEGMEVLRLKMLQRLGGTALAESLLLPLWRQVVQTDLLVEYMTRLHTKMREDQSRRKEADAVSDDFAQLMSGNWQSALEHGTQGMAADAKIYGTEWHFALEDVGVPTFIWHGIEDIIVPCSISEHVGRHVPGARTLLSPGDGHFSVVRNHFHDILSVMTEAGRPPEQKPTGIPAAAQ